MNVPIIGQPQVTDWVLGIQIKCPCGESLLMMGRPGVIAVCHGCRAMYRMQGVPQFVQDSTGVQISVPLGVAHAPQGS